MEDIGLSESMREFEEKYASFGKNLPKICKKLRIQDFDFFVQFQYILSNSFAYKGSKKLRQIPLPNMRF